MRGSGAPGRSVRRRSFAAANDTTTLLMRLKGWGTRWWLCGAGWGWGGGGFVPVDFAGDDHDGGQDGEEQKRAEDEGVVLADEEAVDGGVEGGEHEAEAEAAGDAAQDVGEIEGEQADAGGAGWGSCCR